MPKDLAIILEDRPGTLAMVGEALGQAGVNIDGICGMTVGGRAIVHVLVQDEVQARQVLEASHIPVSGGLEVLVLEIEDQPSTLGTIARRLADEEVNIHLAYMATSTRLVIGVDDLKKARSIIQRGKPVD